MSSASLDGDALVAVGYWENSNIFSEAEKRRLLNLASHSRLPKSKLVNT